MKQKTPLEYMVDVMNDPKATPDRRDRMAIQAAALMCKQAEQEFRVKRGGPKKKPLGKKAERQERANKAATVGIFAVPSAPRQVVAQGDIRRSGFRLKLDISPLWHLAMAVTATPTLERHGSGSPR